MPTTPTTYHTRGEAYRALHQHERAIDDFGKALSLDATHLPSLASRGEAYEGKGDRAKAMEDYNGALTLLVILDACRFNPFGQRMAQVGAATRLIGERRLARIEPAHPNVIVAYTARDGQIAIYGKPGDNSPHAKALVKYLAQPGLELGKFFRRGAGRRAGGDRRQAAALRIRLAYRRGLVLQAGDEVGNRQ